VLIKPLHQLDKESSRSAELVIVGFNEGLAA